MNTLKFKTNIKCSGCLEKATPHLNEVAGEDNWEVDLQDVQKTLTVVGEVTPQAVSNAMERAGFQATEIG